MLFNTPILLLTFTRLDTTRRVFERIKAQKPKYLFVASDGPRPEKPDDIEKIEEVRNYILSEIDWHCELKTLFRDKNLGCGVAPSSAITWFFENVTQGIILEDDCLPEPDFFKFCEETLEFYENDERIWEISGTNLQGGRKRGEGSYYFSNYGGIWGWATWARAWKHFSYEMESYPHFLENKKIEKILSDKNQQKYWIKTLNDARKLGSWWDYQWVYTFWNNNGICIVPNVNLIKNIGFDSLGTHTLGEPYGYTKLAKTGRLPKIIHPNCVTVNIKADNFLFRNFIKPSSLIKRIYLFFKRHYGFQKTKNKVTN